MAEIKPKELRRWRLLSGGPVNVPEFVAKAVAECDIGHRDPRCRELIQSVSDRLCWMANVSDRDFSVIPVTGSGTAANEMVISSTVRQGDLLLVLANGEFGYRLHRQSDCYNHTALLDFGWGNAIDVKQAAVEIERSRPAMVAMVHHETSTGMLNPAEEIGRICAEQNSKLFVDAISSFGADPIDLAQCKASFATTTAGKSLGAMPGVSIVFAHRSAVAELAGIEAHSHYLNLPAAYDAIEKTGFTVNTPAVALLSGLDAALRGIERKGIERHYHTIHTRTNYLRQSIGQ